MKRRSHLITWIVIMLAVSVIIQGSLSLLPRAPSAHAATISMSLIACVVPATGCASAGWWQGSTHNPTITVHPGDTLMMSLTSADHNMHQFIVDVDGFSTCSATDPCSPTFTSSTSWTYTVGLALGTYDYGCVFHPTMAAAMGFIVQSAGDFSLAAAPASETVQQGSLGTASVNLTGTSQFQGTVSVSSTSKPSGLPIVPSSTAVSIPPGGSVQYHPTIAPSSSTPVGTYTVNITGTSGTLSHSTTITVTVTSLPVGGSLLPKQPDRLLYVLVSGIVIITALVLSITVHKTLERKRGRDSDSQLEEHRTGEN